MPLIYRTGETAVPSFIFVILFCSSNRQIMEDFHSPQLPDSPSMLNPGTPIQDVFWSEESDDARFSNSDVEVVDLNFLVYVASSNRHNKSQARNGHFSMVLIRRRRF